MGKMPALWVTVLILSAAYFRLTAPICCTKESSRYTMCFSKLRTLANIASIYSEDADGMLPPKKWHQPMAAYLKKFHDERPDSAFTCPKVEGEGHVGGYAFNSALVGQQNPPDSLAASIPLFFETDVLGYDKTLSFASLLREGRHGPNRCAVFANGMWKGIPPHSNQ